jgi:hypothetical protein
VVVLMLEAVQMANLIEARHRVVPCLQRARG